MGEVRADTAQYSFKVSGQIFQVLSLNVREEMSGLYWITLTLWKDDPEVDIASLIRQDAEVKIAWGGKEKKYFGIVSSFSQTDAGRRGMGGVDTEWGEYLVEVVPTLWLLGQKSNCRIFQNKGADAIIKKVLDERGMAGKYEAKMSGCEVREYCVQYRETDLAFISRLMEEEGIFYYFTHDGPEKMVIGDSSGHYGTCSPDSSVQFKTETGDLGTSEEVVTGLTYDENAYSGKVKLKDYDYRGTTKPLKVEQTAPKNNDLELYDYKVERYLDDGRGRALAKIAVDAQATMRKNISGSGSWRSASAGCKVTISKAYRSDLNGEWAIVSAEHGATQAADAGVQYWSSFVAIPASVTFRPMPRTAQPNLNPQTARVVGPAGEKFYMDDKGRAKVQFHWDLEGKNDEESSCWIRVAQPYAGMDETTRKKHGFQWHPMIGDEVIVDFLDGDPDNPVIVGSVYNATNTPLVQPSDLVRGRILTPYQHQLLMDDKGGQIRLNTGGGQSLTESDKSDGQGSIALHTSGDENFLMEDGHSSGNNLIFMRTADAHQFQMSSGTFDGIIAQTKDQHQLCLSDTEHLASLKTQGGHTLEMRDTEQDVTLETTGSNKLVMEDLTRCVTLQSTAGAYVKLNDAATIVEISTPSGQQKITLSYGGTGINLEVTTGDIEITAPSGNVTISGRNVTIEASQKVEVKGPQGVDVESSTGTVKTTGVNIEDEATMSHKVQALSLEHKGNMSASLEAGMNLTLKGLMVSSEATTINQLKGILVKIN